MNYKNLFKKALNLGIKSALITLIAYSQLILANLSPLLGCLVVASLILLIEWLWVTK